MSKRIMPLYGFSNGAYRSGNYVRYRKGTPTAYKHISIFTDEAKRHRVNIIMDMLRDWRLSPFENEGAIRAGIRSSLCLQGYAWQRSDQEAEILINNAFMNLGVKRPTWEQGQREYVEPRENCLWCHSELDDLTLQRGQRFCTIQCAKAFYLDRNFADERHKSKYRFMVYEFISRGRQGNKVCYHCGNTFQPLPNADGKFCSQKCYQDHKAKQVFQHSCIWCGKHFTDNYRHSLYCCSNHKTYFNRMLKGKDKPKVITPPVFDYFFAKAA